MPASSYNPNPSVLFAGPLDTSQTTRATPDAFGANVGQAGERIGQSIGQASQTAMSYLTEKQQQLNDADVADAETKLNEGIGDVDGWYKSLQGREAVSAHPEAVEKIKALRQNISKGLPNDAARRSFNLLAARTEGFTLRDYGNHMGTQVKKADTDATKALEEQTIANASSWSVANNEDQLGYALGTIASTAAKLTQIQGWDLNTDEGKVVYNKYLDEQKDKLWENVIKTVAYSHSPGEIGSPSKAVDMLEKHKNSMPKVTYNRLSQALDAGYRAEQARVGADETFSTAEQDWGKSVTTKSELPDISPERKTEEFKGVPYTVPNQPIDIPTTVNKFIEQESGGRGGNRGQIQADTWKQFANPGEKINDPSDNRAVMQRIIEKYSKDYHGDQSRIAVAYFSGPGNVAPAGSANPWKEDKSDGNKKVSEYVSDMVKRTGGVGTVSSGTVPMRQSQNLPVYRTKAEYMGIHQGEILQKAEDWAEKHFPGDTTMKDQVVARTTQRINRLQNEEREKQYADNEAVYRFVFPDNNGHIISDVSQIENGPPEIRDAWNRMDALKQQAITARILTANTKGRQSTYGTQFWERFNDMVDGKITSVDQLYKYIGPDKNSPLTNTGLSMIAKEMSIGANSLGVKDPQGQAFLQAEKAYFLNLRIAMVGGQFRHNANGERVFQEAVLKALPKIQAARSKGTGAEMFDPTHEDFPGDSRSLETRTQGQILEDMIATTNPLTVGGLMPPEQVKRTEPFTTTQFDKVTDVGTGQALLTQELAKMRAKGQDLTPQEYNDLHNYFIKRGWVKQPIQPVPGFK